MKALERFTAPGAGGSPASSAACADAGLLEPRTPEPKAAAQANTITDPIAQSLSAVAYTVTGWVTPKDEREQAAQAATWLKKKVDTRAGAESHLRAQLAAIESRGERCGRRTPQCSRKRGSK